MRIAGTILRTIADKADPTVLTHAEVSTATGRYRAVFGPGLYKAIQSDALKPGDDVLICMKPMPTIMGVVKDG